MSLLQTSVFFFCVFFHFLNLQPFLLAVLACVLYSARVQTHSDRVTFKDKPQDLRIPSRPTASDLESSSLDALLIDSPSAVTIPFTVTSILHNARPTNIHGEANKATAPSADGSSSGHNCCVCGDHSCIHTPKFDTGRSITRQVHRS